MLTHTENATTTQIGSCIATCLGCTAEKWGTDIVTWELVYPRYIHSELMTYRTFSRNASSSRATPLSLTIDEVRHDPVFFDYVGKNQRGMTAGEELSPKELKEFYDDWVKLGSSVAAEVERMAEKYGIHKQTLNRALEPWLRIRTLVTTTEYEHFFSQRLAADAQPEMQSLATAMYKSMQAADIRDGTIHMPYSDQFDEATVGANMVRCVAACARVCVGKNNGQRKTTLEEDARFVADLWRKDHRSPFEHIAYAQTGKWEDTRNFSGWVSLRAMLECADVDDLVCLEGYKFQGVVI